MGKMCVCPEQTPGWMVTFSDLCSLLLCFFVLLVSMSTMKENDFMVGSGLLRGAFGVMAMDPSIFKLKNVAMPTLKNIQRAIIDKMRSNLQDFIQANGMGEDVKIIISDKGVALSLSAPLLFNSGSAELKPEAFPLLERIFDIAQGWPNIIRVEGHTDNTRIHSELYASNWDLSFARALSVVRFAVDFSKIHPSRLVPVAYGEYRPVADNDTEEGRAKNRRIEIFMEYKKESEDPFK
jgi:chemotaxis protein MotB